MARRFATDSSDSSPNSVPWRLTAPDLRRPRTKSKVELSPIKAIELAASRLPDVISLAQGIPSFDTPDPIKRFVIRKIEEGACARYSLSPGLVELRELISEALLEEQLRYDPDGEIIVTCGSIEAVTAALLAHVGEGDEVLLASPTYASYEAAIRTARATPRYFALKEDANFDLDPDAIAAAITRRTRAILLCNPNNPTGTIYSPAETKRMMELAERHDLLVITDDVYKDFLYTNEPAGNPAQLARHRVVRICSFSKAYGMTGWRVGFLHAPRELAGGILAVHDALVTCAPVASQYGAIAALQMGEPFLRHFREEFRRRRALIIERLDSLPQIFDYQTPNASYFAFPRLKDTVPLARNSRALAFDILQKVRVALVPGVAFGPTGEAHLRFCYAREADDIERAFDRLGDYFLRGGAARRSSAGSAKAEGAAAAAPASPLPEPWRRVIAQRLFQSLARLYLARTRPRVVAIAGGRGKTVLKRTLKDLLGPDGRVRSNPLSHNTPIGLSLSVLDTVLDTRSAGSIARAIARAAVQACAGDRIDTLILEMGVRLPGDAERLLEIVVPDALVVMPLGEQPSDVVALLRKEMETLVAAVERRGGRVFLCADDPRLEGIGGGAAGRFSRAQLVQNDDGWWLRDRDELRPVLRPLVGDSTVQAVAAGVQLGEAMGLPAAQITAFLATPS